MNYLIFLPILLAIILTWLTLPKWIKKAKQVGLIWEDMNKYGHPKNVAASGGIVVLMAFVLAVLSYVAIRTFFIGDVNSSILKIFVIICVMLFLGLIGFIDDILGWQHGGLSWKFRLLLAFLASLPLVVINAGQHMINLPFFGKVYLGMIYPLLLIPLGIAGATTTYNFLAGFNGLEAGQGIIILGFLSYVAAATGNSWLAIIGLTMVGSLLVFYYFNRFPAKVFPGDILTYSVGALIACMAVLGNFERIAVFVFLPYILEVILKVRGKIKKQSFGIPDKKNNLKIPYEKIYGLTHLSILILSKFKKEVREKDVVYFIFIIQIVFCLLALILFKEGIFI